MKRLLPIAVLTLGLLPHSFGDNKPQTKPMRERQPSHQERQPTRGGGEHARKPAQPRREQPVVHKPQPNQPRPQHPRQEQPVHRPQPPRHEQPAHRPQPPRHEQPAHRPNQPNRPNQPGHNNNRHQVSRPTHQRPQVQNQRTVVRNNVTVIQRNHYRYVNNNRVQRERFYNHRHFHNRNIVVYRPYYSYDSSFWGFYSRPYARSWYYTWGWHNSPWYVSMRWYYSPYPYYTSSAYWLTDYVISSMLNNAYQSGYRDGYNAGYNAGYSPISEEIKAQLRFQVEQANLQFQKGDAVSLEQALQNQNYIYPVDTNYQAVNVYSGQACNLSEGDFIRVSQQPSYYSDDVVMTVVASKPGSCTVGSQVAMDIDDLQEMLNSFSESVEDGLRELNNNRSQIPY
ncbi:MAG: hypothetical protein IPM57_03110 [Oligoflexia bacterium]|nr:hypothetical protein [Oligoflexia bacterium]